MATNWKGESCQKCQQTGGGKVAKVATNKLEGGKLPKVVTNKLEGEVAKSGD